MARYSQYRAAAGTVKEGWGLTQAYHHAEHYDPLTARLKVTGPQTLANPGHAARSDRSLLLVLMLGARTSRS